jgi:hypothetical protein
MKQCALIIGNNEYLRNPLRNAVRDATAVAGKLTELGFAPTTMHNIAFRDMDAAIEGYAANLPGHGVGLFFFAGHAVQIDGVNYLTGIDTKWDNPTNCRHSSVQLNKVIELMEKSGIRTSIVILDACRDNPYDALYRGGSSGFAPIYAPKGMLIAFSTSPGQRATDGYGDHGAYTEALLMHIGQQDLPIETMFKRVRNTLSSITGGKQISWEHTSLMGDYCFNPSAVDPTAPTRTGYSASAIADADFVPEGVLKDVISGLETLTWPKQNPAVMAITPALLAGAKRDELFVLGRNLYQSAVGSSRAAIAYLKDLKAELQALGEAERFHFLNGMLYEIYFDSRGRRRKEGKMEYFEQLFAVESEPAFQPSFDFIRSALAPFHGELFYIPASKIDVVLDVVVVTAQYGPTLGKVDFQGDNVLYNAAGDAYFNPVSMFFPTEVAKDKVKVKLANAAMIPLRRFRLNFVGEPMPKETLVMPDRPNLLRVASTA